MKLTELSQIEILKEGQVDPNVLMSIAAIIKDGKVTNSFQYLILYRTLELFKYGAWHRENFFLAPLDSFNPMQLPTQVEILTMLKALPPEKVVALAKVFYSALVIKNEDTVNKLCNHTCSLIDWVDLAIRSEAND